MNNTQGLPFASKPCKHKEVLSLFKISVNTSSDLINSRKNLLHFLMKNKGKLEYISDQFNQDRIGRQQMRINVGVS